MNNSILATMLKIKNIGSSVDALARPQAVSVTENKTLALADAGKLQKVTAAATVTVPPSSSAAFPAQTQVSIASYTASDVVIAAGAGVTIRSKDAKLKIDGQYAAATLIKIDTDEWLLVGALKA